MPKNGALKIKRTPLILLLLSFVFAAIAGDLVTTKDSEEDSEAADHDHIEEEVKVRVRRIRSGRRRVFNRAFNRNSLLESLESKEISIDWLDRAL